MVSGLIQQNKIRLAEQYLGQLHPHAPSAAELPGGPVKLRCAEPQAVESLTCGCHIVAPTEDAVPFAGGMEPVTELVVALALIVSAYGYLFSDIGDLLLQAPELGEGR